MILVPLLVVLVGLGGCCILLPTANAQVFDLTLDSRMDHSPFLHSQGTIKLDGATYTLPHSGTFASKDYSITYNPDPGFVFRYWYVDSGDCYFSDLNSQSTSLHTVETGSCNVGAVYDYPAVVGGGVQPVNTFAVLAPWLAVIGLVGCIGTVVVVSKKCRP